MINCSCYDTDYPIHTNAYNSCISNNDACNTKVIGNTDNDEKFKNDCESNCPNECDRIELNYIISGNEVLDFKN